MEILARLTVRLGEMTRASGSDLIFRQPSLSPHDKSVEVIKSRMERIFAPAENQQLFPHCDTKQSCSAPLQLPRCNARFQRRSEKYGLISSKMWILAQGGRQPNLGARINRMAQGATQTETVWSVLARPHSSLKAIVSSLWINFFKLWMELSEGPPPLEFVLYVRSVAGLI